MNHLQPLETQKELKMPSFGIGFASAVDWFGELAHTIEQFRGDHSTSDVTRTLAIAKCCPTHGRLEQYKQVSPEALSQMLRELDQEGMRRRRNEGEMIRKRILMMRLGLLAAFLLTLLFLAVGFYMVLCGYDATGTSVCCAGLVSVVVTFLHYTAMPSQKKDAR